MHLGYHATTHSHANSHLLEPVPRPRPFSVKASYSSIMFGPRKTDQKRAMEELQ